MLPDSQKVSLLLRLYVINILSEFACFRVIEAVSSALSAEERRTRYVTRQVSTILQLIDIANKSGGQSRDVEYGEASSQQPSSGSTSPHQPPQQVHHLLVETSLSTSLPGLSKTTSIDQPDCGGALLGCDDATLDESASRPSRSESCPPTVCEGPFSIQHDCHERFIDYDFICNSG
jgi:hypothetical protein